MWLAEGYPLSLTDQLLPIVELMALNNTHFEKLKDFLTLQVPSGFPVKIGQWCNEQEEHKDIAIFVFKAMFLVVSSSCSLEYYWAFVVFESTIRSTIFVLKKLLPVIFLSRDPTVSHNDSKGDIW